MTYTPEQIPQIALKDLKEIEEPNIMDLSPIEKRDLAKSTSSANILRSLATDKNSSIRCGVAVNPNTPEDALRTLATDKNSSIRYGVAVNPNTPADILRSLATDEYCNVRYGVAVNPNTPADILRSLATDKNSSIRYVVTLNPNYKPEPYKTLELTKIQYDAIKQLIDSCKNSDLLNINL